MGTIIIFILLSDKVKEKLNYLPKIKQSKWWDERWEARK